MKIRIAPLLAAAAAGLALSAVAQPSLAASECTRVIGYEPWTPSTSIDPMINVTQTDVMYIMALFEPLAWVTSDFGLEPRLATSWEPNADGSVWTFHLREGVKFHDGTDFDAEDVVYTYERMLDPESASPAADVMPFLKRGSVEAVDSHTVRFTAAEPVVELPFRISNKFTLIVSSDDSTEDITGKANGTGPFMLDEFSPAAVRATLHAQSQLLAHRTSEIRLYRDLGDRRIGGPRRRGDERRGRHSSRRRCEHRAEPRVRMPRSRCCRPRPDP